VLPLKPQALFALVLFLDSFMLLPWLITDYDPPTSTSQVAGITDVNHHSQLVCCNEGLANFFAWAGFKL
jgi:hypothetical protein